MGMWYEVMCDVRRPRAEPRTCHTDTNNNPAGWTRAIAIKAARELGWKIGRGDGAVCPECRKDAQPLLSPRSTEGPGK